MTWGRRCLWMSQPKTRHFPTKGCLLKGSQRKEIESSWRDWRLTLRKCSIYRTDVSVDVEVDQYSKHADPNNIVLHMNRSTWITDSCVLRWFGWKARRLLRICLHVVLFNIFSRPAFSKLATFGCLISAKELLQCRLQQFSVRPSYSTFTVCLHPCLCPCLWLPVFVSLSLSPCHFVSVFRRSSYSLPHSSCRTLQEAITHLYWKNTLEKNGNPSSAWLDGSFWPKCHYTQRSTWKLSWVPMSSGQMLDLSFFPSNTRGQLSVGALCNICV